MDTTVQEKAIAHPTDARLTHRAIEKLVALAKREGVELRQSYLRVAKRAAIRVRRYTHAHQFKRARRELKFLRVRLGRIIRDVSRKIEGNPALEGRFGPLLDLARRVRLQEQRQRGLKVYSLHAPEVECIGKGKARAPYEFGCKVSIVTPVTAPKGGQFVLHAKALHGNPYDGHTLGPVILDLEKLTGVAVRRIHGDKGYRGHNYPDRFKVWISGQVRRVTKAIRREMRRRAAVEPVIGHLKDDHRMVRTTFVRPVVDPLSQPLNAKTCIVRRSETFFTDDQRTPGKVRRTDSVGPRLRTKRNRIRDRLSGERRRQLRDRRECRRRRRRFRIQRTAAAIASATVLGRQSSVGSDRVATPTPPQPSSRS